jgi:hypothetical protein
MTVRRAAMPEVCAGLRLLAALLFGLLSGCAKPAAVGPAPDAAVIPSANQPPPSSAKKPSGLAKRPSAKGAPSAKQPAAPAKLADPATAKVGDDDLKAEEPEANPYSETVTLRLSVTPQVKALVMWGGKQVARLAPGSMDAEIVRPRGSGPVDLEIKAEGFMPYHTRLYSDRNDKVSARLYRPEEAVSLFGFKRSSNPTEKKK